jgi:hypothetical protein
VSSVVVVAALAPVMASPSVRAELVTQLVMGETALLRERQGEWCAIRSDVDGYDGWINGGYLRELTPADAAAWHITAGAFSGGARIAVGRDLVLAPLRARLQLEDGLVTLPDGRAGRLLDGAVQSVVDTIAAARTVSPDAWALDHFRGTYYLWGGVTPLGVDCSGLVQTTFLLRGVTLPRDSSAQAGAGGPVALNATKPGDLLFFRSESGSDTITHVALVAPADSIVHSTISCGGVVHESFARGTRAGDALRPRLVAARRVAA